MDAINRSANTQAEHQAQANIKAGGGAQQPQPFTIINQIDRDDLVGGYIRSPIGGQMVLNLIKENPSDFRAALGV